MKHAMILALLIPLSTFADAGGGTSADPMPQDTLSFKCKPSSSLTNGLSIKTLKLALSNQDPEATMTIRYKKATSEITSNMSYEGNIDSQYELIPVSDKDGSVAVKLLNENGKWVAFVTNDGVDTFSVLKCKVAHTAVEAQP